MFKKPTVVGHNKSYLMVADDELKNTLVIHADFTLVEVVLGVKHLVIGFVHPLEIPGIYVGTYISTGRVFIKYHSHRFRVSRIVQLTDRGFEDYDSMGNPSALY